MRSIFEIAKSLDGKIKEVPGAGNNPAIVKMFERVLGTSMPDSTAWCAVAVGSILLDAGYRSTGKATARSYLDYGQKVSLADAKPGDIAVFWRGSPTSWQGHVGIFVRKQCGKIYIYSGNDSNEFKLGSRVESQLLGIRRVTNAEKISPAPIDPIEDSEELDLASFPLPLWHGKNLFGAKEKQAIALISELSAITPNDIDAYCPNYRALNFEGRTAFWIYLLSLLAWNESKFKSGTTYEEDGESNPDLRDRNGNNVISRGLFQVSVESANGYVKYGGPKVDYHDLHDNFINLRCAVAIAKRWLSKDQVISKRVGGQWHGLGRYWSNFRGTTGHDFIISKCEDAWG